MTCHVAGVLEWASAAFAFAAAGFWFWGSVIKLPPDKITWKSIDQVIPALRRQGFRNAIGAGCAAAAAFIQGVLLMAPTCIKLG